MDKEVFINEFEKEVVVLNTTTLVRLFSLGSDVLTLYIFYVKNAKIQSTNSIWANNSFCKTGLKWGSGRLKTAKKILMDNKFISIKTGRDKLGRITKHYVRLHYLMNNQWSQYPHVDTPTDGYQTPNALDKKLNAIDEKGKKDILSPTLFLVNQQDILNHWNLQKIVVHKELTEKTKVQISKALQQVSAEELKDAMSNYGKIINSNEYFFSYRWSITEFLQRGNSKAGYTERRGYWMFLTDSRPFQKFKGSGGGIYKDIRDNWESLTLKYNKQMPLDKVKQEYMGVNLQTIKTLIPIDIFNGVIQRSKNKEMNTNFFRWLEEGIAVLLYKKDDEALLKQMLTLHHRINSSLTKIELGEIVEYRKERYGIND